MQMSLFIFLLLLSFVSLVLFVWTLKENKNLKQKLTQHANDTQQNIEYIKKIASLETRLEEKEQQIAQIKTENQRNLTQLENKYEMSLKRLDEELKTNLEKQNKNFLLQNKLMLGDDGKKIFNEVLAPIKESIKEYEKGLQEHSKQLVSNKATIQTQIENMFKFSQKIGEEADKLAKILKGDKKARGIFGELQLKSVLEQSGLRLGEQYKLQEHFKDESDESKHIPDAVVYLDRQRSIAIDAKFPLPNNLNFEDDKKLCEEICQNLKARIDELARKPYVNFTSHDYMLLFIPYQNILDLALEFEPNLYQYAYKKNIYLTTPTTLFMALNTINISWRYVESDNKKQEFLKQAGIMYNKIYVFVEKIEKIKNSFSKLHNSFEEAENTLFKGKGNLLSQAEKLKELGAKTNKQIEKKSQENLLEFEGENINLNPSENENLFSLNQSKNGENEQ